MFTQMLRLRMKIATPCKPRSVQPSHAALVTDTHCFNQDTDSPGAVHTVVLVLD